MAFIDVLCPACAGKISLHDGIQNAYCPLCGDAILLKDAMENTISDEALNYYTADQLYEMARDTDNHAQLMHAAAKKGSADANLFIGVGLVSDGEYADALSFLKVASDAKNPNGMAMYAATLLDYHNDPAEYDSIISLMESALKKGCDETVAKICKENLEKVRPVAERNRRARNMEATYQRALQNNDYDTIKRLAEQGHAEAADLVNRVQASLVCRYYQNGLCTKQSTSYYLAHCDDPRKVWCSDYRKSG